MRYLRQRADEIFQSTLPRGSDFTPLNLLYGTLISIHAPSRERQIAAGAVTADKIISIHAPSRERPCRNSRQSCNHNFNPRSLAGATLSLID